MQNNPTSAQQNAVGNFSTKDIPCATGYKPTENLNTKTWSCQQIPVPPPPTPSQTRTPSGR